MSISYDSITCLPASAPPANSSETSVRNRDKNGVQHLANQAQDLLDAALAALNRGESCQEMTVLIARDGGIQMCADSDWPLDSLMLDRGARTGYRVSPRRGSVRVEGREGLRRCVLEGSTGKLGTAYEFPRTAQGRLP